MDIFKRLNRIRLYILSETLVAFVFLISAFAALIVIGDVFYRALLASVCVVVFLLFLLFISFSVASYKQLFSRHMLKTVMETVFENVSYEPDRALLQSVIESTDMILLGNHYESSEYRQGEYRSTRFTMADVLLKNVIRQGKREASVTYFSGTWMIFDFEKPFRYPIQIKEKSFLNAQKPRGENPDLERMVIRDENFSRFFKVYAENESAVETFLSTAVREAILSLNYELRGDLMFYFNGNRLHIALHGQKAHYEPPLLGKIYREDVEKVLLADCRAISAFLDRLSAIDTIFENGTAVTEG